MYLFELWFSLDRSSGMGLLDHMVVLFLANCLSKWFCSILFCFCLFRAAPRHQSGFISLHFHQERMRVLALPYPHQHWVLSVFWILAMLIGEQLYLIAVLICNSLTTYNIELFFFLLLQGSTGAIWRFPDQGLNWSYSCWPQPQQLEI